MKTEISTDEALVAKPPKPARKRRRRSDPAKRSRILEVVGALIAAFGIVVLAHAAFGVSGPFALTGIADLGFVAAFALVEFGAARNHVTEIDLTDPALDPAEPVTAQLVDPTTEMPALRTVADAEMGEAADVPIRRRKVSGADVIEFAVAAIGGAAFAELIRVVFRMRSLVGLCVWWYIAFVAIYFVLGRDRSDAERAVDRVITVLVVTTGIGVAALLSWLLVFIIAKGLPMLTWSFFTEDLSETGPLTPGGGAAHAIVGTLEQVGIATLFVVPVGIMTAVYLHEIRGRLTRPVRFIVDAMSGLPSIVAGLLVFTVFVEKHGFSGFSGSIALAVLMLPTMTRASEEILRTIPDSLREGALALGAPQWRLVQRVVLPTALAGLTTAALLAIARAIGETAPMLLTAFGSDSMNLNPFKGPQADLPLFVWKLIRQPDKTQQARAFTGALVLVMLVFVLFVSARMVANRGMRKLGRSR